MDPAHFISDTLRSPPKKKGLLVGSNLERSSGMALLRREEPHQRATCYFMRRAVRLNVLTLVVIEALVNDFSVPPAPCSHLSCLHARTALQRYVELPLGVRDVLVSGTSKKLCSVELLDRGKEFLLDLSVDVLTHSGFV